MKIIEWIDVLEFDRRMRQKRAAEIARLLERKYPGDRAAKMRWLDAWRRKEREDSIQYRAGGLASRHACMLH
jgi:hypothetical protein